MTPAAAALVATVALASPAAALALLAEAHPFHVTLAQADYNAETAHLEVALKVWPPDLQRALERRLDRDVDLDRDPDIERQIAGYTAEVFRVRTAHGDPVPLEWVGMELDLRDGWLYFELSIPGGPSGIEISNRAFFELEVDQVNTVNVRIPDPAGQAPPRRVTLTLTPDRPSGRVPEPPP